MENTRIINNLVIRQKRDELSDKHYGRDISDEKANFNLGFEMGAYLFLEEIEELRENNAIMHATLNRIRLCPPVTDKIGIKLTVEYMKKQAQEAVISLKES